ncbi:DedA family protein [Leptospira paudalimensis]|uniref:DedA family protein n=1 Tax=Leptospira paudalimensis TaxID=2950024 RepID=A0ABT3M5F1_9LEPT|nr:DedA family protein [Leptospira paudalimensis]MCW7503616.1 DedA family protein [Leptospira paudalimensis]
MTNSKKIQNSSVVGNLFLILFFSTFVSEDLTCITSGLLAKEGKLLLLHAIIVTGLGIFVGDLLLYFVGFFFGSYLKLWKPIQNWESKISSQTLYKHWQSKFSLSVMISRFLPGTRLPLYLMSGYFKMPFFIFVWSSFFAVLIWTTLFVSLVFYYGKWISEYYFNQSNLWTSIGIGLSFYGFYLFFQTILIPEKRKRVTLQWTKLFQMEFWPSTLFYLPLIPYLFYLSIRYRGIRYLTATNPGIIASGIAGESKYDILNLIPNKYIAKSCLVSSGIQDPETLIKQWLTINKIKFPIIAKPDKGERGFLVQKIHTMSELKQVLYNYPIDWLLQEWIEGPFEVGIFYCRYPDESQGMIFSVTDKVFPEIIGDGISTLESLIENHPRFRFQMETHKKHNLGKLQQIIPLGEKRRIGSIGNHIQGCMFQDGGYLLTNKLKTELIKIGDRTKGFYFGRFDIRFQDVKKFRDGKGFKIIELNGVTSESTNLYDPKFSILQSYSILWKQWKFIFEIGYQNYQKGIHLYPYGKLVQLIRQHNLYRKKFSRLEKSP